MLIDKQKEAACPMQATPLLFLSVTFTDLSETEILYN